jgi:hypothetical protein
MSNKSAPKAPQTREDRLKAALKANLGRRKVQARAKASREAGSASPKQAGEKAPDKKE